MADAPYLGELRFFSIPFAPRGWAMCNGQLLPISQNQALFALLGTSFGGNGTSNFALPDLRGRLPFGQGGGHVVGESGGAEAVALNIQQIPAHTHQVIAATTATTTTLTGKLGVAAFSAYAKTGTFQSLYPLADGTAGGSQPHTNLQPYVVGNWCISLLGDFPSQN